MAPLEHLKDEQATKSLPSPNPAQYCSTAGKDETENFQRESSKGNVSLVEASQWNQLQTQMPF